MLKLFKKQEHYTQSKELATGLCNLSKWDPGTWLFKRNINTYKGKHRFKYKCKRGISGPCFQKQKLDIDRKINKETVELINIRQKQNGTNCHLHNILFHGCRFSFQFSLHVVFFRLQNTKDIKQISEYSKKKKTEAMSYLSLTQSYQAGTQKLKKLQITCSHLGMAHLLLNNVSQEKSQWIYKNSQK